MTELESHELSVWEEDALVLSQTAFQLDQSRSDSVALAAALNVNLDLWIGIKSLASSDAARLPPNVKDNLAQLFHYVAETTLRNGTAMRTEALDSQINLNLQLSEGLLEGQAR